MAQPLYVEKLYTPQTTYDLNTFDPKKDYSQDIYKQSTIQGRKNAINAYQTAMAQYHNKLNPTTLDVYNRNYENDIKNNGQAVYSQRRVADRTGEYLNSGMFSKDVNYDKMFQGYKPQKDSTVNRTAKRNAMKDYMSGRVY